MFIIGCIGWLGNTLLAICGAPLAIDAHRTKKTTINATFVWTWFMGEICLLIYFAVKHGFDILIISNYIMNIGFTGTLLYYKYIYRN